MRKDEMRNALINYEMLVVDQRNRIINTRVMLDREVDPTDTIRQFAKSNEEIYLKLKSLIHEIQAGGESTRSITEDLGTTESFPATFEKLGEGIWKFHLPPFFSVSAKKRLYNEGRHIYYLIQNLLKQHEAESGRLKLLEKPLVAFRHHICADVDNVFDYDNIDAKRATDAMQEFLLKDDNGMYLTVAHDMIYNEDISFCDIYVIEQKGRENILDGYLEKHFPGAF